MKVDLGDFGENEVEKAGPVEAPNLGLEVELLDDVAGLRVKGGDPGAEVVGDAGGSAKMPWRVSGLVLKTWGSPVMASRTGPTFSSRPLSCSRRARTVGFVGSRTQSSRRSTTSGRMTFWYSARL